MIDESLFRLFRVFQRERSEKTEFMLRRLSKASVSGKGNDRRAIAIAFSGD
jgi:hypothetical protein